MKIKPLILVLTAAGVLGATGYGTYYYGMLRGMQMAATPANTATPAANGAAQTTDPSAGRRVLYWHDPMVPGQKFDKPGKSPFMDMQLVPVYAEADGDEGKIVISPRVQQNLGMRTAEVTRGTLAPAVEVTGNVTYNERDVAVVYARSNGFVEKLHVRAPLDPVRKGQPLAELYVPDWVAAQEEYLSAKRMTGSGLDALVDGARQRMRLSGMNEEQINLVATTGRIYPWLTITAPVDGVVTELGAREGMTIPSGTPLFRINGLGTVWVNAEVPESQIALLRPGNPVQARTPALPGTAFKGRVSAILPEVNPATRTLKVRIELANPGIRLAPGMFATVNFTSGTRQEVLLIAGEAVIHTGRRSVVIVAQDDGRFIPVEVETGAESGDRIEIRKGLQAGQRVVVSGQFLIDSEASLKGTLARLENLQQSQQSGTGSSTTDRHTGSATVNAVDAQSGTIELSHGPIATLQWPAMTMGFRVENSAQLTNLKPGDAIDFDLLGKPDADGNYIITRIAPRRQGAAK